MLHCSLTDRQLLMRSQDHSLYLETWLSLFKYSLPFCLQRTSSDLPLQSNVVLETPQNLTLTPVVLLDPSRWNLPFCSDNMLNHLTDPHTAI